MTVPTLYTDRSNCKRAAKKALGHTDFEVVKTSDGAFYWIDTSAAAADAAGMENDPPAPEPMVCQTTGFVGFPVPEEEAEEVIAQTEPEPFEEPEPKADLTIDLGLTPELVALIYGMGEAAGAAIPVPQKRRGITADAWAAAERGELPKPLAFPASNAHAQKHADKLLELATEWKPEELKDYPITGTNTYSKALRSYREALQAYMVNSMSPPMQEAA